VTELPDDLVDRTHRLLAENRVALVVGWEQRAAVVNGLTGWYVVRAFRDRVECDCQAGQAGETCSHALAAMVCWQESR
jgi:hypothetical protein